MNKIEKLIQELCPEGVSSLALEELFDVRNGYTPSKANTEYWTDGTVPWFRMEDLRKNGRVLGHAIQHVSRSAVKGERLFDEDSLIVATTATIGEHALIQVPFLANQRFTILTIKPSFKTRYSVKFGFYVGFLLARHCVENTNVSGFASVDMDKFRKFKFPLPPLKVQQEIVSILDTFMELEAELEAELGARAALYESIRRTLFGFSSISNKEYLGKYPALSQADKLRIEDWIDYEQPTKYIVSSTDYSDIFETPVLTAGQTFILGYTNEHHGVYEASPENPVIIFDDFTTAFKWVDFRFKVKSSAMKILRPKKESSLDLRYLFHYMGLIDYSASEHARHWISVYSKFEIPAPPIREQQRLAEVLDKFMNLFANLHVGLPAEIQARRKQYEYYRNKLLTFKELDAA